MSGCASGSRGFGASACFVFFFFFFFFWGGGVRAVGLRPDKFSPLGAQA